MASCYTMLDKVHVPLSSWLAVTLMSTVHPFLFHIHQLRLHLRHYSNIHQLQLRLYAIESRKPTLSPISFTLSLSTIPMSFMSSQNPRAKMSKGPSIPPTVYILRPNHIHRPTVYVSMPASYTPHVIGIRIH